MRKPPCEVRIRKVVPIIRAALAILLVREFGYSIYRASKLLDITPAAISNYLTHKRPKDKIVEILLNNPTFRDHLEFWVKKLSKGEAEAGDAICALCQRMSDYILSMSSRT